MKSFRWPAAIGALALLGSGAFLALPPAAGAQTTSAQTSAPIGIYTTKDAWSFTSAPMLHPPKLSTDKKTQKSKLAEGDFLLANFPNVVIPGPMDGQSGPMILNSKLQPVWFKAVPTNVVAMDLKEQTYQGKPALSWWQGAITKTGATLTGKVVVVNQQYHKVATFVGQDGWVISPHDVAITGNDAWVTSYKTVPNVDLTAYGGAANGKLYDFAVQEYDLTTGQLLYTWDAYQHVPLSQAQQPPPAVATVPWDAYHGNSVELVGSNEFLVSLRNTWAIYLVDIKTGDPVWTLGGKESTFSIPPNAQFEWQHDATLGKDNVLSLFDDNCCAIVGPGKFATPGGPAHGLVLKLNMQSHTATLVHQYVHGANFDVAFTGSTQILPNGNVLVGWGSKPYFSEYTKTGKMLLDAVLPGKDLSYRALFTDNWVGKPTSRPRGAARTAHGKATVYASWNGATQVATWKVLAGKSVKHEKVVATKAESGFETVIKLKRSYKHFTLKALDAKGHVLGTSKGFIAPHPGFY